MTTAFREFDSCRLSAEVFDGIECIPFCGIDEYSVDKICTLKEDPFESPSDWEAKFTLNSED